MDPLNPHRGRDQDPVERLNDHHADDLVAVARVLGGEPDATAARADHVDSEGIDLVVETLRGPASVRVSFGDVAGDERLSVRRRFLALARRARAELDVGGGG